jgi:hypothetical protein
MPGKRYQILDFSPIPSHVDGIPTGKQTHVTAGVDGQQM